MRIDWWTLGLQTVNVLILVWLLAHFLYRPVLAAIDRRRAETEKTLQDATEARERAKQAEADLAARHTAATAEGERIVTEARRRAEAEGAAQLQHAGQAVAELRSAAEAAIARERAAMQQALTAQASALAITIAQRLLARMPPGAVLDAFIVSLRTAIANLPAEARSRMAAGPIDIISAAPLDTAGEAHLQAMLRDALGTLPTLRCETHPALIAGFELRSADMLIRANWDADLARITAALADERSHDIAA